MANLLQQGEAEAISGDSFATLVWLLRFLLPCILFWLSFNSRIWGWSPWDSRIRHSRETMLRHQEWVAARETEAPEEMATLMLVDEVTAPLLFKDRSEHRRERGQRVDGKESRGDRDRDRERRESKRERRKATQAARLEESIPLQEELTPVQSPVGVAPAPNNSDEEAQPVIEVDPERQMLLASLVNFVAFNRRDQVRTFLPNADCVPPPPPLPKPDASSTRQVRSTRMSSAAVERANLEARMVLRGMLTVSAPGSAVAKSLFAQLQQLNVEVSPEALELMVEVCIKADDLDATSDFLLKMEALGHSPSNAMLDKVMEMYLQHKVKNREGQTKEESPPDSLGAEGCLSPAQSANADGLPSPSTAGFAASPPPVPSAQAAAVAATQPFGAGVVAGAPPQPAPPIGMPPNIQGMPPPPPPLHPPAAAPQCLQQWDANAPQQEHSGVAAMHAEFQHPQTQQPPHVNGIAAYAAHMCQGGFAGGRVNAQRPNAASIAREMKDLAMEERKKKLPAFSIPDEFAAEKAMTEAEEERLERSSTEDNDDEPALGTDVDASGDAAVNKEDASAAPLNGRSVVAAVTPAAAAAVPSSSLSADAAVFVPGGTAEDARQLLPPEAQQCAGPRPDLWQRPPTPPPVPPPPSTAPVVPPPPAWHQFELSPHAQEFKPMPTSDSSMTAPQRQDMHMAQMPCMAQAQYEPMMEGGMQELAMPMPGYSPEWGNYGQQPLPSGSELCATAEPFVPGITMGHPAAEQEEAEHIGVGGAPWTSAENYDHSEEHRGSSDDEEFEEDFDGTDADGNHHWQDRVEEDGREWNRWHGRSWTATEHSGGRSWKSSEWESSKGGHAAAWSSSEWAPAASSWQQWRGKGGKSKPTSSGARGWHSFSAAAPSGQPEGKGSRKGCSSGKPTSTAGCANELRNGEASTTTSTLPSARGASAARRGGAVWRKREVSDLSAGE